MAVRSRLWISMLLASTVLGGGAHAQSSSAADPKAIFTLQGENSTLSTSPLTDRYYTNGLKVGYMSAEDAYSGLSDVGRLIFGDGHQRLGFDVTQQMYTPAATKVTNPPLSDEPYAGVLLANVSLTSDSDWSRSALKLSVGLVGPQALGQTVQNGFHDLIGQVGNKGWSTQIKNEVVGGVNVSRVLRVNLGSVAGLQVDLLPGLAANAGTIKDSVEAGLNIRFGQGLQNDYGAPRINALGGGDGFKRADAFSWYGFAGVGAQGVARDITLNGNTFQKSRSVKITPGVGQVDAGVALLAFGTRLTYTHVLETQTFQHQKGGMHQFGSLAMSVGF